MKATKVTQLTATFDSAVPADTTFEVKKGTTVIDGKYTVDGSTVTFDATGKLSTGTYTLTAKSGDVSRSAETEVKDEYVAEIKITSKEALTDEGVKATTGSAIGQTEKLAYIYYDVLNQYAESIRTSTTINWTASATIKKVDKTLGRITVSNGYTSFIYGSLIYVTGVHTGSGTVINESVPVGMAQAVDSVKFSGFLNKNDKTKMVESLPKDFTKKTYYLLYKVFDQNGSPLDPNEIEKDSLTFICDNPLLLSLDNSNTSVFTVNGEEYAAIAVEPGQYVDKGGEVNITAISTRTGKKTVKNFVVGSAGVLQSLVLSAPAGTVADGDKDVKLPYTAKDTSGNSVTNYETIVRSTNTLQLSASGETQLKIKEENDGTAGVYWSDSTEYDPNNAATYDKSDVSNDLNRSISLTTVVVGGESNNLMLEVSDIRRPNAIKSIKLNDDNNDAIIARNTATLKFNDGQDDNTIVFLDQYGDELNGDKAKAFFANAKVNKFGKSSDAGYYGIKVAVTGEKHLGLNNQVYLGENINITAKDVTEVEMDTVKYSIAKSADKSDWDDVSKVKSVAYTIVPVTSSTTTDFSITDISKVYLETTNSGAPNGSGFGDNATGAAIGKNAGYYSSDAYTVTNAKEFKVMASYKGLKLSVPYGYYADAENTEGQLNPWYTPWNYSGADKSQFAGITKDILTWADLYDFNSAKNLRKDAAINFKLDVYAASGSALGEKLSTISKKVTVSDEAPKATTIKFITNTDDGFNTAAATTGTLYPSFMNVSQPEVFKESWRSWNRFGVMVFDQYGNTMIGDNTYAGDSSITNNSYVEFTVSDIKENTNDLAHKPDSFIVKHNGSADMSIEGAEIGDTFKITATVAGLSASATVTVGADTYAYIDQGGNGAKATPGPAAKDIGLRELLGYDR